MSNPDPYLPPASADPPPAAGPTAARADDFLRVLAVFHGVAAALTLLIALAPTVLLGLGLFLFTAPGSEDPGARVIGSIVGGLGCLFLMLVLAYAIAMAVAARRLWQRRGWTFCLVMAGISCIWFPYGTVLGIATLIALLQPDVQARFAPR